MTSFSSLPNKLVSAECGVDFAYRDAGQGELPLILLQHFRGNLDGWDPALVDDLAAARRVVAFDNAGVGGSTGTTPHEFGQMAHDAIAFIAAMGFARADILGFSIGSFVAQEIALIRPDLVRRLILASAAPKGADGIHGWAPQVIGAVGKLETSREEYLGVFFTASPASRKAGQEALGRMYARTEDRDAPATWAVRQAQYDAVCTWGIPDHGALQRLSAVDVPVFVANGDSDPMILPHYSYLLAGLIPQARAKIYPDAAHGFLFQHHAEFAADARTTRRTRSGRISAISWATKLPMENPRMSALVIPRAAMNAMASCAICSMTCGVVPVEPPTPALSNATTRRPAARPSTRAGSQLSRFPRKCWSRTSGTSPAPASR